MIIDKHLSIRTMFRHQFHPILGVLLSCIIVQSGSAQSDDWELVPLEGLNTSSDELLIGWDGSSLFFNRLNQSEKRKGSSDWFQEDKSDWESRRLQGWSQFDDPNLILLRTFSSASWPGFETIQHVAIDEERGVLVMSAAAMGGHFDLYMAQSSENGWGTPEPLAELNTDGDEVYPNFQSGTLLFATNGRKDGLGGFDVYESLRASHYTIANPLGVPLNSAGDELAAVSAGSAVDAGYYLTAARTEGNGMDLWWVGPPAKAPGVAAEFAMEFRFQRSPMPGLDIELSERGGPHVFSGQSDVLGRLHIGNIQLDAALSVLVTQHEGTEPIPDGSVCHVFERCPTGECASEYWEGWKRVRSYRMEGGVAFVFDLLPLDQMGRWPRPHNGDASRLEMTSTMWQAQFEKSSFELSAKDQQELTDWLKLSKDDEGHWPIGWKIEITGYADASGSIEWNLGLSKRRAEHARDFLISSGFDPVRVVCNGRGSHESKGASDFDRRVELHWVPIF